MRSGQGDLEPNAKDAAEAFFDAVAPHYDRAYALEGAEHRVRMSALLAALGAPAPGPRSAALVLGVGTGRELPALLDAGFRTTGLDASAGMLARCASRARHGELVRGSFWAPLPFPDGAFGAAVALHGTLAHPPDEGAIVGLARELARVLVPGGVLAFELPTPAWFARFDGRDDGGPGVLVLDGSRASFVDRRTGARIEGLVVEPSAWVHALGGAFVCRLHAISPDEARLVATRTANAP
jgi:SAM-dependent methyltransferase